MKYEIFLLYFLLYFKIHIYKATTHGLLLLFSEPIVQVLEKGYYCTIVNPI